MAGEPALLLVSLRLNTVDDFSPTVFCFSGHGG